MIRTQIYITTKERSALSALTHQTGKNQSELIREAIDLFCKIRSQENRAAIIESVSNLWKERTDLPDFSNLRKEADRFGDFSMKKKLKKK